MPAATALYGALAVGDTYLAASGQKRRRRFTKPLLMPVLMIGQDRPDQVALACSWAGDVALLGDSDLSFQLGLGSFLIGHLAWVKALRVRSSGYLKRRPLLAIPFAAVWVILNAYLWPKTGKDRIPVVIYSASLLATALAAADTGNPSIAAGGALFLVSDALIALHKFADVALPWHEGAVMATYTGAQFLLSSA
jgi:uncharacterized membrane protein YhhN